MVRGRHITTPVGAAHPMVRDHVKIRRGTDSRDGRAAVEGLWSLRLALDAGVRVEAVFVCWTLVRGPATHHALHAALARGAELYEVSEKVFRRLVERDGPDGVAAIVHVPRRELEDLRPGPVARVVVIDGLDLPGNIGTIVRAADGAGATAVALTGSRVRIANPTLVKASMGTVFTTPVVQADRRPVGEWLAASGFQIVAADPDAPCSYRSVTYQDRVAIVVGNERTGLSSWWREAADMAVSIPMLGAADSLNVGHATALLLYEALHRAGTTR